MTTQTANDPPLSATLQITSLLKHKKTKKAVDEAEAALRRWPQSPRLWNLLAEASLLAGDPVLAWEATMAALEFDPGSTNALQRKPKIASLLRPAARSAVQAVGVGGDEGSRLEAAYAAVTAADDAGALDDDVKGAALAVLLRLARAEEADRRWPLATIGRELVAVGDHRSMIYQLPRVRSAEDRRELLAQHEAWGEEKVREAFRSPIHHIPQRTGGPFRVGLLSSDLRIHVVLAYADPLIEHARDNDVDLYCYSTHPGPPDDAQRAITDVVAGYRHLPSASTVELAQTIADDALDALVEIGGSTNHNRAEAMAYRLAPVQASWLGYPHSVGLRTIDYFICDPYLAPTEPDLLTERLLELPDSWLSFPPGFFREQPPVASELPEVRKGHITFGTANSTYKYSVRTLHAWARVLAAVPDSHFLIVRPEGGSKLFRNTICEHFAREGVAADRIEFAVTRGGHLPYYGEIDISLDTLPQTGGVTTCESLWMGVPVVSLAGEAVFERLSHSILINAGLADLSVKDIEGYVEAAVNLANDRDRRQMWRANGRDIIRASPLGDVETFTANFYAALRQASK